MGALRLTYQPDETTANLRIGHKKGCPELGDRKTKTSDLLGLDYYPFGSIMPGRSYNSNDYRWGFNGKEKDDEWYGSSGTVYDYGFRIYDARIAKFLSVDPMAHLRTWVSPYNFVQNNPILRVDPTGALDNPIYDKEGEFLGTDDKGLQGEAIIMDKEDFTQGMAHDDALSKGTLFSDLGNLDRWNFMDKGWGHWKTLDQRPDWDGVVTIKEGIAWAKSHPNLRANPDDVNYSNATPSDALYLDVSKMDFGRLSISDFKEIGVEQGVNLLNSFNGNPRSRFTTYALGRTRMTLHSTAFGGIVTVSNGTWNAYDWDYGGNLLRETLIFGERTLKGLNDTHGFPIQVYGTGLLNK